MSVEYLPHQFEPRPYQMPLMNAMLVENKLRGFVVWHRRSGKDKTCWNILICKALQRTGNYFYVFPEIGQGKKAVWLGIDKKGKSFIDHIPKEFVKNINNSELRITLTNGSTIQIVGANRYDKLVGISACGIIFSEYAVQTPFALRYLKPSLNETNGWLLINSTPRGHNHCYKLFNSVKEDDNWHTSVLTVSDTEDEEGMPIVSDEQIEDDKHNLSIEELRQEYFCDFDVALANAYFSKYLRQAEEQNRVGDFPVDCNLPVHSFWDLGISDSMAIWLVQLGTNGEIRLIHYYENNNQGFEHYINYIHDYRNKYGYVLGDHYAPHDIAVRELSSGQSRLERARKLGIIFRQVPRTKDKMASIEHTRALFSKFYIHKTECQYGIDCIMEYHAKEGINGAHGGVDHNWASHCCDALQLIAQARIEGMLTSNQHNLSGGGIHQNPWSSEPV